MGLLAGIIEGGLQGGAQAVQGMAQGEIANQQHAELSQQLSDQELAKMKAAAVFNADQQSALRQAQVARINDAQSGIVNSKIAAQYPSLPGAEDGGDNGLRNAQDSQGAAARAAMMSDPHLRVQAAEQTGDVPVGTMATLLQKSDNSQNTLQWRMAQDQTRQDNAQLRADTQVQLAQGSNETKLMIASMIHDAKARGDKEDLVTARTMLSDTTRSLDERRKERNDLNEQALIARDPAIKKQLQTQISSLDSEISNLKDSHDLFSQVLMGKLGVTPKAAPAPTTPKPAAPASANPAASAAAPALPKGWSVDIH